MHIVFFEFATTYGGARQSTVETAARLAKHVSVTVVDAYGCCPPFVEGVRASGVPLEIIKPQPARIVGGATLGYVSRFTHLAAALPDLADVRWRLKRRLRQLQPTVICCNETKGMAIASTLGLCPVVGYMRGWYRPDNSVPYVRYLIGSTGIFW